MTRVRHCVPIISVACLIGMSPVQADDSAGVLHEVQGRVMVNQGKSYIAGHSGMRLKLGTRVLTMDGASAVVKHTDGCLTRIEPNSLFTLREPSGCRVGVAAVGIGAAVVAGTVAGITLGATEATSSDEPPPQITPF